MIQKMRIMRFTIQKRKSLMRKNLQEAKTWPKKPKDLKMNLHSARTNHQVLLHQKVDSKIHLPRFPNQLKYKRKIIAKLKKVNQQPGSKVCLQALPAFCLAAVQQQQHRHNPETEVPNRKQFPVREIPGRDRFLLLIRKKTGSGSKKSSTLGSVSEADLLAAAAAQMDEIPPLPPMIGKPPSAPSSIKSKQAQTPAPPVIRDKPPPAVYDK